MLHSFLCILLESTVKDVRRDSAVMAFVYFVFVFPFFFLALGVCCCCCCCFFLLLFFFFIWFFILFYFILFYLHHLHLDLCWLEQGQKVCMSPLKICKIEAIGNEKKK